MEKFIILAKPKKPSNSISRKVKFENHIYEQLMELSKANGLSLNRIVNLALEYTLKHVEIKEE